MDASRPARLLVVWWSMTDGTRQLAQAVADGAARAARDEAASGSGAAGATSREVLVTLLAAPQADARHVLESDAYVFATPENLASMAGMMKDFFDRTYYAALDRIAGRPYATIVCAGSDGQGAARQVERIATGWRLRRVAEPLIVITHAQTPEAILARKVIAPFELERAGGVGEALAAGLSIGLW